MKNYLRFKFINFLILLKFLYLLLGKEFLFNINKLNMLGLLTSEIEIPIIFAPKFLK